MLVDLFREFCENTDDSLVAFKVLSAMILDQGEQQRRGIVLRRVKAEMAVPTIYERTAPVLVVTAFDCAKELEHFVRHCGTVGITRKLLADHGIRRDIPREFRQSLQNGL